MGSFGGDPGVPVIRDGMETFPLVPVAVGLYSISFNIFNTLLLFRSLACRAVLCRLGREHSEEVEDYLIARFLDPAKGGESRDRQSAGAAGLRVISKPRDASHNTPATRSGARQGQGLPGLDRHPQS